MQEDKDKLDKKDTKSLAWSMFQETGQLGYYMLHKELSKDD